MEHRRNRTGCYRFGLKGSAFEFKRVKTQTHADRVLPFAGMMTCLTRRRLIQPQRHRELGAVLIKPPNWNPKVRRSCSQAAALQWKMFHCERAVKKDETVDRFGQLPQLRLCYRLLPSSRGSVSVSLWVSGRLLSRALKKDGRARPQHSASPSWLTVKSSRDIYSAHSKRNLASGLQINKKIWLNNSNKTI